MKASAHIFILLPLCVLLCAQNPADAQKKSRKELKKEAQEQEILNSVRTFDKDDIFMEYIVENGDTIFIDEIEPTWVFSRGPRGPEWRRYYRLVYNFNKCYPYALLARALVARVDKNIAEGNMSYMQREKYITSLQKALLKEFEPVIRKMTVSQGKLLVRMVDREVGMSSYDIVKDYKSGIAAGFWQGVAKLFGQNLKSRYDPEGEDILTEELIKTWEAGKFDQLYYSIFMEWPSHPDLVAKYL